MGAVWTILGCKHAGCLFSVRMRFRDEGESHAGKEFLVSAIYSDLIMHTGTVPALY